MRLVWSDPILAAYFTESCHPFHEGCHPERSKAATPRRVMTWVLVIMTLLMICRIEDIYEKS